MADQLMTASAEDAGAQDEPAYRAQSLERALDILEELAVAQDALGMTELSVRLKLHISTVHRLLAVLMRRGYVRRLRGSGRYTLGMQIARLSADATDAWQRDLRREAHSVLEALVKRSQQSANLVKLVGNEAVYVDQVVSDTPVRVLAQIGKGLPLYCTGGGKALLAFQAQDDIEEYVRHVVREQFTDQTVIDDADLCRLLAEIRDQGYAFDWGEMEPDVRCVAAPIFDNAGNARAAISISGPASRFTNESMHQLADLVRQQANELSRKLGLRTNPQMAARRDADRDQAHNVLAQPSADAR
jgi:DNA-binding IclR family transcriptional regulator